MTEGEFAPWIEGLIRADEHDRKLPKLCPFCDGIPKLESDLHRKEFGRDRFRIVCSSCYAGTRWYDSPNEAWLMWNRRVGE